MNWEAIALLFLAWMMMRRRSEIGIEQYRIDAADQVAVVEVLKASFRTVSLAKGEKVLVEEWMAPSMIVSVCVTGQKDLSRLWQSNRGAK